MSKPESPPGPIATAPSAPVRQTLIDHAIIALCTLVAYGKVLPADRTFNVSGRLGDWLTLTQPAYTYTGRALADGVFPLWNTNWFAGYPHFAVPSNAVLYPATILYGLFDFPVAAKIVVFMHVFACATFSYWLGRDLFRSRIPSLYLAAIAIIGLPTPWSLVAGHLWNLATITWMPLAFLFLRRILLTGRLVWVLAFAFTLAIMVFAGDPQSFAFMMLWFGTFVAAYTVIRLILRRDPAMRVLFGAALCLVAVLLGLALAAIQLLPSMEFMEQSIRKNGVTYEYLSGRLSASLRYHFSRDLLFTVESPRYIPGKVTLALACVAIVGAAAPEVAALLIAAAVCFLYADLPEWMYDRYVQYVPVFNSLRGTGRVRGMIIFIFYLLTAHGLHVLVSAAGRAPKDLVRWAATALIVAAAIAVGWSYEPEFGSVYALTGVALGLIAIAAVWRRLPMRVVAPLILGLLVIEAGTRFTEIQETSDASVHEVNPDLVQFSKDASLDRVLIIPSNIPQRHGPAVSLLCELRNVEGYHALYVYRYARFFHNVADIFLNQVDDEGRLLVQGKYQGDWVKPQSLPVLDLLNIRYILRLGSPVPLLQYAIDNGSTSFSVERLGELYIYMNHGALPPLFPIHEAAPVESDDFALKLIRDRAMDYRSQATLEPGTEVPPLGPATGPEPITLRKYGPNSIEAEVTLTAPGILVLSEVWYPGWYAIVDDGPPQPTLCVNTLLQAVPVPAGTHRVEFVYRPDSLRRGVMVTATALAVSIACAIVLFVRAARRKTRSGDDGVSAR